MKIAMGYLDEEYGEALIVGHDVAYSGPKANIVRKYVEDFQWMYPDATIEQVFRKLNDAPQSCFWTALYDD